MKLEIGPGKRRIGKDWLTIGPDENQDIDVFGYWGEENLPFADEHFTVIYASHVIEHIWWFNVVRALEEAYRCLKERGVLEIWTVDFAQVVDSYLNIKCGDNYRKMNPENDFMYWINGKLFSYAPPEAHAHHSCFDYAFLDKLLTKAGFRDIHKLTKPRGADHGSNLGIGGVK